MCALFDLSQTYCWMWCIFALYKFSFSLFCTTFFSSPTQVIASFWIVSMILQAQNLFITLCFFRDYNRVTCLFIPDPLPNASLSGMNLHPRILFCFLTRFTSVSAWLLLISSCRDFVVVGVQVEIRHFGIGCQQAELIWRAVVKCFSFCQLNLDPWLFASSVLTSWSALSI